MIGYRVGAEQKGACVMLYALEPCRAADPALAVRETSPTLPPKPRLLDRVREAIRTRHYSRRTEKAYVHWIKRYIFHHDKRHPVDMGGPEVAAVLTSLAVDAKG